MLAVIAVIGQSTRTARAGQIHVVDVITVHLWQAVAVAGALRNEDSEVTVALMGKAVAMHALGALTFRIASGGDGADKDGKEGDGQDLLHGWETATKMNGRGKAVRRV